MISKTISIITANWWFYLFFAVLIVVANGIQDSGLIKSGGGAVSTMLWLLFARFVHRAALYGVAFGAPNPDGTADRGFGGFMWRGLTLLVLALVLALPVIFSPLSSEAASDPLPNLIPYILTFLVIYAILLSLAGSWLPASVHKQNASLGAALKRGSRNFFKVFVWIAPTLLLGIVVEFAVIVGFTFGGFNTSIVSGGSFHLTGALVLLAIALIEAFSVSLASVVLSHFYLAAEGIEEPVLKPSR